MDADVGSLEVGKQADLAAFALDAHDPRADPEADPVTALVHTLAGRAAALTVVQGREVARAGRALAADAPTHARVRAAAARLRAHLAG